MTSVLAIVLGLLALALAILIATLLAVENSARARAETSAAPAGRGHVGDVLKRIRALEIKIRHSVDEAFAASYHSIFKGQGMNFEEVREYQPGDEIRSIDWNVTARLSQPHVKIFTEERELTLILLVDLSASGNYGSQKFSKREIAAEIAATFALSAIRNHDRVALIIFTDQVELFIPPGKGRTHVLRVIREVLYHDPESRRTDLAQALEYLNRVIHRRSIAFLISDFHAPDFSRALSLSSRRHDLTVIQIRDPLEEILPRIGRVMLEDQESGEMMEVNTSNEQVSKQFEAEGKRRQMALEQQFARCGVDHISLATNEDYLPALRRFFAKREQRLVHG